MVRICVKLLLVLAALSLIFSGVAFAGKLNPTKEKPVTLRLAYLDNPTWPETANIPEPEHAYAVVFKAFVESATNGAVKVELFPSGQLGGSRELTEMVKTGTLDLAIETGNMGSFYPPYQLINIPYVFISDEVAWWLFDNSKFWKDLMADMEKKTNLLCLGMGQNGVRNFTNNIRPIHEPKDMEGIKFRVMQSPVFVKTVEALGAKAIPIAWPEVYTSLQTGVIDGQENPIATIYYVGKLHEVQKYLTLDAHTWSENMLMMNSKKFKQFPEDIQQIIKMAGLHGARADRASEEFMSRVVGLSLVSKAMEVYQPTAAQIKMFQEKAQPAVVKWLKGEVGDKLVDDFLKAVKEAELALGYK